MYVATLGEDPLADLPLGVTNPVHWDMVTATMPLGTFVGTPEPDFGEQVCPVGDPSADPLIPGVCNTSALVGATVLLGLLMVMSR